MSKMDRRGFLKKAGIGAAAAAAVGAGVLTGCSSGAAQTNSSPNGKWDAETDLVVAGAGVAGLCAAMAAVEKGINVTLVEASGVVGGTALFAGGAIHTWKAKTLEDMRKRVPLIDPELGKVMMDNWQPTVDWLSGIPAPWEFDSYLKPVLGENAVFLGSDYKMRQATTNGLADYFKSKGGEILMKSRAVKLFTNDNSNITGIRIIKEDKTSFNIKTKAVILANGGFAANPELRVKYYGLYADVAVARCVPYNRGEALLMASEVGALMSRNFGTSYGHTQSYPSIVPQTEEEYEKLEDKQLLYDLMSPLQMVTPDGIAVNVFGRRFVDESLGDDLLNQEIMKQEEGRCFLILDANSAENHLKTINLTKDHGAVVEIADTIDELLEKVGVHRYDAAQLKYTIDEYNRALSNENTLSLPIARSSRLNKITTPPFYALQITAGVSGPYGGIKINSRAQALGYGDVPIIGLYAAPHAAGGIYSKHYGGSLALCATFGRIAGISAAEDVATLHSVGEK